MTPQEAIDTIKIAIAEVEWDYPMDYAVAFEEAIKALEIADRLEQAHWTRSDGISDILYDLDCTAGVSQSDIFVQGYEKALADIRGDNNGKE